MPTTHQSSAMEFNRREFLSFLSMSAAAALAWKAFPSVLTGTAWASDVPGFAGFQVAPFTALPPLSNDDFVVADGARARILLRYGDVINEGGDRFGFNNDFIAFLPLSRGRLVLDQASPEARTAVEALLWVNHETPMGLLMHGNPGTLQGGAGKSAEQIRLEQLAIGASIVRIVRENPHGAWRFGGHHKLNRRITALTPIPYANGMTIRGQDHAIGTLANCSGGVTPWGTVLTCEENYKEFYGELDGPDSEDWQSRVTFDAGYDNGWRDQAHHHPWHYGWVVEADPMTGSARKLVAMGRVSREGTKVTVAKDGRAVVYSGDDHKGGCIFKFVSRHANDLSEGQLYAADVKGGRWVELDWSSQPALRAKFSDQLDVLLHTREAGLAAGATPMDRPEGIDIHPKTGNVFIALTNNSSVGNHHGSFLCITEKNADPAATEFTSEAFLVGGPETGFSCPDNIAFDRNGSLWFTTDVSKDKIGVGLYAGYGNNAFFVVPAQGPDAGRALRFASGPVAAELTGPCFSGDEQTIFLSVQHPGETSIIGQPYTSSWPDGTPGAMPRSAIVAIDGLPWKKESVV